jgi:tubulin polyglutamylase TTLL11
MFDEELKPWLLEINGNPSLNMDHFVKKNNNKQIKKPSLCDKFIKE